jgi:SAM-dependent MidA family methyltransferase
LSAAPAPELLALIEAAIMASGGALPFSDYMQRVLNEPGLGYYHRRGSPIGVAGDFTTAPEMGGLFGRALARAVVDELQAISSAEVLELGAGTGALAAQLLQACRELGHPIERYRILEPSAGLQADQRARLEGWPVEWLERLPTRLRGVCVANEVLDALPVECFAVRREGLMRRMVTGSASGGFEWAEVPAPGRTPRPPLRA